MEEVVEPPTDEGAAFEPTRLRQFTVFLDNRVGRLQALVRAIENDPNDLLTIAIEESADSSLVRIICRYPDASREALRMDGFAFIESDVLAVELPRGRKQPIMSITAVLLTAEINIHYCYPLIRRPAGPALVLYVEDPTLAAQLLIRRGYTLLGESDFKDPHRDPDDDHDANGAGGNVPFDEN